MLTKLVANFYRKFAQRKFGNTVTEFKTEELPTAPVSKNHLRILLGAEAFFLFSLFAGLRYFRNPRLEKEEAKLREAQCVAVAGPSGVGKGTLINMYLEKNDDYELVPSHTTRAPRDNELDGVHYYFINQEQFLKDEQDGKFIEYNKYGDNYYGTSSDALKNIRERGKIPLLDIDINGCKSLIAKNQHPYLIFVVPPEPMIETLESRLNKRGTETEDSKRKRLEKAKEEISFYQKHPEMFDRIIENNNLRQSFQRMTDALKGVATFKKDQFKKKE
jgi:guanylate kinase